MDVTVAKANALRQIVANGQTLAVQRRTATLDLVTGASNGAASTTGTWTAVDAPLTLATLRNYDANWRPSGDQAAKRLLYVAASGAAFAPALFDSVTLYGAAWRVFGVSDITLKGSAVLYLVGVERE